ncbi:MAG: hypothetical protein HY063_08850 [Bacteroidetes bacterium]|nr:hypothetical protein [Bacteroidota bacterium]
MAYLTKKEMLVILFDKEPRLLQIAALSEEGLQEKEIVKKTGMALGTVKNKRKRLLKMLGAKSIREAKIDLIKHGFLVAVTTKAFTPDTQPSTALRDFIIELEDKEREEEWSRKKNKLGWKP